MMIPIPKDGVYRSVAGLEEASAGVEEIIVTATAGQRLIRLPEGSSYLGFIFARGNSPQVKMEAGATPGALRVALRYRNRAGKFQPFALGGTKPSGRADPSPKK